MCTGKVVYAFLTDQPKKGNKKTIVGFLGEYPSKGEAVRCSGNIMLKRWGHLSDMWRKELSRCIFGTKEQIESMDIINPIGFPEVKHG